MSDAGICGNTINPIAGTSAPLVCDLPAGHDGWHSCDNPPAEAPVGRPWLTSTATRCHWQTNDAELAAELHDAHHHIELAEATKETDR